MDRFSPVAPACVRVLVLPVGQIEESTFLHVVSQLQQNASVVQLASLGTVLEGENLLLSPSAFPRGSILFNFTVCEVSEHHRQLSPFELCRETLVVVGVAARLIDGDDDNNSQQQTTQLKKVADELREKHGRVVHRHVLLLQHAGDEAKSLLSSNNVTTLTIDSEPAAVLTAMQQVTVAFLHELSTYAKAMQASPSIQTPGQFSQGALRSMVIRGVGGEEEEQGRPMSRQSASAEPRSPLSDDQHSRPTSQDVLPPPATTFDQIAAANSLGRSDSHGSHHSKSRPRTTSFGRVPVHTLSKDKLKDRGKARVGIVTASIYLMSGQWAEALKILIDNTTKLRSLHDYIWNAKGLELITVCILLHLWAGIDVQVPAICFQLSDKVRDRLSKAFAAELAQKLSGPQTAAEKLSSALPNLLKHALLLYHAVEGTMELPYLAVAETTVRFCKILAHLHSTNGLLDQQSISRIVYTAQTRSAESSMSSWSASTFQSTKPLSKASISDMLTHALPVDDENTPLQDYIGILTGVASIYVILGMERKKAMTLKTLVDRLTHALNQARKVGAAAIGMHPAATLSVDSGVEGLTGSMQGHAGLVQLARDLASVYGVHIEPSDPAEESSPSSTSGFGSSILKIEILRDLLKLCEASPDLKGISSLVVAFMTSIYPSAAVDPSIAQPRSTVPTEEQVRLLGMLHKTSWLSKQLDIAQVQGIYWDPFLVRGIEVLLPQFGQEVIEITKSGDELTSTNPLLYDPNVRRSLIRQQQSAAMTTILVVGETSRLRITLQNPFDVGIDIESLQLVTDGVELQCSARDIRLGPARMEHVLLDILPHVTGTTQVTGCRIKVAGCDERTFNLTATPWSATDQTLAKSIGQDILRQPAPKTTQAPKHDTVALEIIAPQPQLVIDDDVHEPTHMLLEGEQRPFAVKLKNISNVDAYIAKIVCNTENIKPPKYCHDDTASIVVAANQSLSLKFELQGRAESTTAHAQIIYAASSSADAKHARTCEVKAVLTVQPALRVQHLSIQGGPGDSVLLEIDLFNNWNKTVQTAYQTLTSQDWHTDSEHSLAAGELRRVQVHVPRWLQPSKSQLDQASPMAELQKHFRIRWKFEQRSGIVHLDHIQLPQQTFDALHGPAIEITLTCTSKQNAAAALGEFVTIRATLKNRSCISGPAILQLQCRAVHMAPSADRLAHLAGSMSRLIPALSNEDMSIDFAVCPLLTGPVLIDAVLRPALPVASTGAIMGSSVESLRLLVVE